MADFDTAIAWVAPHEFNAYKHYTCYASDPGHGTNWGITQATLTSVLNRFPGFPASVADLTWDQAKAIYKGEYWPTWAPLNSQRIATKCFDMGVNLGTGTAIRYLQTALGVTVDGHFGPITLQAVQSANEAGVLIDLCGLLVKHYQAWVAESPDRAEYLDGLLNRAKALPPETI